MAQEIVISAKDLSLTFATGDGAVHALKNVSLDIEKGEFVSFIGPSGCGKTTFLRVMADLEQPTGGSITVNGVSPSAARQARAYGYVFQAAGLYPWRSIGGNIRLPLEIMGFSKAEQAERVKKEWLIAFSIKKTAIKLLCLKIILVIQLKVKTCPMLQY